MRLSGIISPLRSCLSFRFPVVAPRVESLRVFYMFLSSHCVAEATTKSRRADIIIVGPLRNKSP